MERTESEIYETSNQKKKLLLSISAEIDSKFRNEAKKREVTISDLLPRLMDERDYYEDKLMEKERYISEENLKMARNIIEAIKEITKANLELNIIAGSLTSIPKVTEEARNINQRCEKSSEIIQNFNIVTNKLNEKLKATINEISKYESKTKENTEIVTFINIELNKLKENIGNLSSEFQKKAALEISESIKSWKYKISNEIDNTIESEKRNIISVVKRSNKIIYILAGFLLAFLIFSAGMFYYNYYTTTQSNREKLDLYNRYYKDSFCMKKNLSGFDYDKLCQ